MSLDLRIPGTLEAAGLAVLVDQGGLTAVGGIPAPLIQPASIDLRLSAEGYRMPGSVLPLAGERVRDLVEGLAFERIDLSKPAVLARNQVYVVRLMESAALPAGLAGYANGKSTTGRIDLATRVLADGSPRYDRLPPGYQGELWIELIPRSFTVVARQGVALNQAIFFAERRVLGQDQLAVRHARTPLLRLADGSVAPDAVFDGRLVMTADLDRPVVGFVAKRTQKMLILDQGGHRAQDFFDPLPCPDRGMMFLEQDRFYILATRERVVVPNDLACEMVPYEATAGDFRAHYAGFFDPGWGIDGDRAPGAVAVLEVRPHQDDLLLRHRQPICAMAFEALQQTCTRPYGTCGNTYAAQDGPRLSKHFS
ncbi:2'-deoxycytidine 5'-triphosphate deaminase [Planctomycetota bacterium]|nr:2'-deoxycytidine 5'-triphosphate deaminase [Planctomycetota bacterium]